MYKVTVEGAFAGYSDTAVYVKVAGNGSYVPCDPAEAGGVCVKLPYEHTDEDGNTVKTAEDIVFKLPGGLVPAGTRINWKGKLKRAAADLWDTPENTPDAAPALWEDIQYRDGVRIIPETITAGLAFAKGEPGYWGDELYSSLLDNNVWTPAAYPAAWERVE